MEILEIQSQEQWEDYLSKCKRDTFLQTWQWGEFQKEQGKNICRLVFLEGDDFIGMTLCVEMKSRFEKYIYCPRGPLLSTDDVNSYTKVLEELKLYWKGRRVSLIKVEPAFVHDDPIGDIPKSLGFKHAVNFVQSENNWMIDLEGENEEDLFEWCKGHGMSKNYPTYIRKARRQGVEVTFSKDEKDWDLFHTYLKASGGRKAFEVKSKKYHLDMWKYLGRDTDLLRLGIARKDGRILAMIVIAVTGSEMSALYSAQTDVRDKLRAPMLLRWECMLMGQREGVKRFNNWGVLPEKKYKPSNPGFGYSQYKRGFGGYVERIERTYEYSFDKLVHPLQRIYDTYLKLRYYRFR